MYFLIDHGCIHSFTMMFIYILLLSEEKLKAPAKDVPAGGLPQVPSIGTRDVSSSPSIHPICGPGSAFGRSLLHKAVCDMDINAVQSQLSSRPDYFDRRDDKGYCPIHSACALCIRDPRNSAVTSEIVRMLIASGADASIRDPEGNTPLHWAARAGDRATAQLLLLKNNPKGRTRMSDNAIFTTFFAK